MEKNKEGIHFMNTPAFTRQFANYKWALVLMLWVVSFFNYADRSAITAVMPMLRVQYGFTDAELGLLSTAFFWVYSLAAPLGGFLGDRFPRKRVILGALLFWSALTAATPLAWSLTMFVIVRALTGLGEAFYYPAGTAMISDYHHYGTRTRALSIHQTAVCAGGILGTTFAGYLAERYEWKYAFYLYGLAGIILAVVLWKFMRPPAKTPAGPAHRAQKVPLLSVFKTKSCLLISVVFCGANFVNTAIVVWLPTYLHDRFGKSLTEAAAIATSSIMLAGLVAMLAGGILADLLVKRTRLARFYLMAASLISAGPFVYLCGLAQTVGVLVFGLIGAGFIKGIFDSCIYAAMHDVMAPAERSTAVGMMNFIGFIGAGLAPYIVGVYAPSLGLGAAIGLTSVVYIAAGSLLLVFRDVIRQDVSRLADSMQDSDDLPGFNPDPGSLVEPE